MSLDRPELPESEQSGTGGRPQRARRRQTPSLFSISSSFPAPCRMKKSRRGKSQTLVSTGGEYSQMLDSPLTNGFYRHVVLGCHLRDRRIRSVMQTKALTEKGKCENKRRFHFPVRRSAPRERVRLISSSHVVIKPNQEKTSGSKRRKGSSSSRGMQRART